MDLLSDFISNYKNLALFSKKDRLLVAVSGGMDSMVLTDLLLKAGLSFSIAHCNFKLRGEESNDDANFVSAYAGKSGLEYLQEDFDTAIFASANKMGTQEAARALRYRWFETLLTEKKFSCLLTAHHQDDNLETILMNFFKGTGINGLKGILPKNGRIIRPLLFAERKDIVEYAKTHQVIYREDSSNSSNKYSRNFFRNELIPGIEKIFPQVKENLKQNASRFRGINEIYNEAISKYKASILEKSGEEYFIPVLKLQKTTAYETIFFEILSGFGFRAGQLPEAVKLLRSESGKYIFSSTHRLLKNRKWLIISPLRKEDTSLFILEEGDSRMQLPGFNLQTSIIPVTGKISADPAVALIDHGLVTFPLIIRKWKQADYFYPLGMQRKKKLSRFFIDNKMSLLEKESTWIIESNKKIIWIIGKRIDDRFKITHKTKQVLHLRYLSS